MNEEEQHLSKRHPNFIRRFRRQTPHSYLEVEPHARRELEVEVAALHGGGVERERRPVPRLLQRAQRHCHELLHGARQARQVRVLALRQEHVVAF
jgi:hypothetical protein